MKLLCKVLFVIAVIAIMLPMVTASVAVTPPRKQLVPTPYVVPYPVYLANGKALSGSHEVVGRVTSASPAIVTLSGAAVFANSTSYFCTATGADAVQTLGPQIVNLDGAHFQIIHAAAEQSAVTYRCIGI